MASVEARNEGRGGRSVNNDTKIEQISDVCTLTRSGGGPWGEGLEGPGSGSQGPTAVREYDPPHPGI